jgi:hypothetical protein
VEDPSKFHLGRDSTLLVFKGKITTKWGNVRISQRDRFAPDTCQDTAYLRGRKGSGLGSGVAVSINPDIFGQDLVLGER